MWLRNLYLTNRFFLASGAVVVAFIFSFVMDIGLQVPQIIFYSLIAVIIADALLLFRVRRGMNGNRFTPDRLSNGD